MHAIIHQDTHTLMKTIEITDAQHHMLEELVMFAYEMDVPEQKGWNVKTYDDLVDRVIAPHEVVR